VSPVFNVAGKSHCVRMEKGHYSGCEQRTVSMAGATGARLE
jgi:hypothetical protein